MSIANGKYSMQTIVARDTYIQLNYMWDKETMNLDESNMEPSITSIIAKSVDIFTNYQNNSKKELVRVAKKRSVNGEEYYDPADILESMRAFYYAPIKVYKSLCALIERNLNVLGRQFDKKYKCHMVDVRIDNEVVSVPVIPDDQYQLVYQIIAEYSNTWI